MFAAPLPLRDRQLRIELYRTASSTQRGRLVSIANVWLHSLLPPGLDDSQEGAKRTTVELESMHKHQRGGRVMLKAAVVDQDLRRAMYQAPVVEEEDAGGGEGPSRTASGMAQRQTVERLQSTTEAFSTAELRQKALMSGGPCLWGWGACGCGLRRLHAEPCMRVAGPASKPACCAPPSTDRVHFRPAPPCCGGLQSRALCSGRRATRTRWWRRRQACCPWRLTWRSRRGSASRSCVSPTSGHSSQR